MYMERNFCKKHNVYFRYTCIYCKDMGAPSSMIGFISQKSEEAKKYWDYVRKRNQ